MTEYFGDYKTGATVRFPWTSKTSTGAAVARTTAGTIVIYKNGSTTQRASLAGVTDTTNFDSVTGLNLLTIDLSNDTDAGFYAAGNDYTVVLTGAVWDGVTRNEVLFTFSIYNRSYKPLVYPVTTPLGTETRYTLVYGVNATLPVRDEIIQDATRSAVDLSGTYSVLYTLTPTDGGTVITGTGTVVDELAGRVRYEWQAGDLANAGDYRERWEITGGSGTLIVSGPLIRVV